MSEGRERSGVYLTGERLLVACFALLTVYYGYETLYFRATLDEDIVGPATFPRMLTVFALVLCTIYFLRNRRKVEPGEQRGKQAVSELYDMIPVGIMLAYVLVLEEIGFPLATFLFITVIMRFFGEKWLPAAIYGFGIMVVIFSIFYFGLQAFVPMGRTLETERWLPFLVDIRRAIGT